MSDFTLAGQLPRHHYVFVDWASQSCMGLHCDA